MRIPRIYTTATLAANMSLLLEEAPSHHLSKVLRMQPGRELTVFNGTGGEYTAQITAMHKKQVEIRLGSFDPANRESPLAVELAIGISKGERMDWVVQKATELGVSRLTLLPTGRTEVRLQGERLEKKMAHWQNIIISACEQCQRNRLPELCYAADFNTWLEGVEAEQRFVLHHRDSQGLPDNTRARSVALLIGPEGGLSDEEIRLALAQGFQPLTLGPRVLRTETAPVAALSLVQYCWGDFRQSGE